jgi:hypothetical protein
MPVEAFKTTVVSSIPTDRIKTVVTTSGTSGNPSYLVRDFRSLLWTGIPVLRWTMNLWAITLVKDAVKRYDKNPERYGMCIGIRKTYEEAIKEAYKECIKTYI